MDNYRYNPYPPPYLLYGFLGLSLAFNMFMVWDREPQVQAVGVEVAAADVAAALPNQATLAPAAPTPVLPPAGSETYTLARGEVNQSLARTFQDLVDGEQADAVAAVYSRLWVWDLDLRRDLRRGDEVALAWKVEPNGDIDIPVAYFRSGKLGTTLKAYRYQAPGDEHPSYWFADGTEVPHRLTGGPIEQYNQITALLKDRPSHKGMDFKTPVGTPIVSPKPGTVTRVNWNWTANGNCVEVRYADGTLAKFLHLDKVNVQAGQHVASGEQLALSGNTGRSTAPHLHYQLEKGDRTVDPLEYHGSSRRSLDPRVMDHFRNEMARLDALLGETAVAQVQPAP